MCRFPYISVNVLLLILGNTGCTGQKSNQLPSAAKSILEKADQIELLSLDPEQSDNGRLKDGFHGWKVLGKTVIDNPETQKSVVSAVKRGIAEGNRAAGCFDPRHAIHATHNEKPVDILICFHCSQVLVYVDNKEQEPYLEISGSPEPLLDKILTEANVPLAPKSRTESSDDYP